MSYLMSKDECECHGGTEENSQGADSVRCGHLFQWKQVSQGHRDEGHDHNIVHTQTDHPGIVQGLQPHFAGLPGEENPENE